MIWDNVTAFGEVTERWKSVCQFGLGSLLLASLASLLPGGGLLLLLETGFCKSSDPAVPATLHPGSIL